MEFDIVFFLQDSFILEFIPNVIQRMKSMGKKFKSVVYFPVDGVPRESWIKAMSAADVSVTYTNWGKGMCSNVYPPIADKLRVIPHGISLREFYPHPPEKRAQLRKMFFQKHADKFIIINVNRNQQRKDIPRTMMAFKEFKKSCPNSIYYLHCAERDVGWDLPKVAENLGLVVGEDVIFPPNFNVNMGVPVSMVNDLYNCADACISAAVGEGWGLSSVEAMATGTPCVFPENTSLTEIFADGRGFLCRSGDTPNFQTVMPMDNEVIRPLMNINDMVKYLKRLYEKPEIGMKMADKALKWVKSELQWERSIVPEFDRIFTELYDDLQTQQHEEQARAEAPGVQTADWRKGETI
jgi:glycosyltransferase involved in cell wall biosynthesis